MTAKQEQRINELEEEIRQLRLQLIKHPKDITDNRKTIQKFDPKQCTFLEPTNTNLITIKNVHKLHWWFGRFANLPTSTGGQEQIKYILESFTIQHGNTHEPNIVKLYVANLWKQIYQSKNSWSESTPLTPVEPSSDSDSDPTTKTETALVSISQEPISVEARAVEIVSARGNSKKHITGREGILIADALSSGYSCQNIAELLCRPPPSIRRWKNKNVKPK